MKPEHDVQECGTKMSRTTLLAQLDLAARILEKWQFLLSDQHDGHWSLLEEDGKVQMLAELGVATAAIEAVRAAEG